MNLHWLVRMARWARRPPSARQVRLVLALVAACALLYGIELIWGWPEALTVEPRRGWRIP